METIYLWLQIHVNSGKVEVKKVLTASIAADVGTKEATTVMLQTLLPIVRMTRHHVKGAGAEAHSCFS